MTRAHRVTSPDGAHVTLLGGILGVASDVARLEQALAAGRWDAILLGIPFEDLDAIRATVGHEREREFERDSTDDVYLRGLERFEAPVIPPPDLYAAYEWASGRGVSVEAIDLGDEAHADAWTRRVGMFELLRNNRRTRKLPQVVFRAKTLDEFAVEWDRTVNDSKGLRKVQDEREEWMASRIHRISTEKRSLFALVPLARLDGLRGALEARFGFRPLRAPPNR